MLREKDSVSSSSMASSVSREASNPTPPGDPKEKSRTGNLLQSSVAVLLSKSPVRSFAASGAESAGLAVERDAAPRSGVRSTLRATPCTASAFVPSGAASSKVTEGELCIGNTVSSVATASPTPAAFSGTSSATFESSGTSSSKALARAPLARGTVSPMATESVPIAASDSSGSSPAAAARAPLAKSRVSSMATLSISAATSSETSSKASTDAALAAISTGSSTASPARALRDDS
mmetsp:Transcript_12951/g.40400  ORF Transcript_12951/g.40400 Transcript_12951/m.40400 type:complete len:235 (-) Transcript_12951:527-1231(-)